MQKHGTPNVIFTEMSELCLIVQRSRGCQYPVDSIIRLQHNSAGCCG
jgi:hypothetical protein